MSRTRLFLFLSLFALLAVGCTSTGAWSPEATTAAIGGAAAAGLTFLRTLHESGALSTEQFAKVSQSMGAMATIADVANQSAAAIAQAMLELKASLGADAAKAAASAAQLAGELATVKAEVAEKWSTSEVVAGGGVTATAAVALTNKIRDWNREKRGEPIGHKPAG